jgi:translocator protein
MREREKLKMSRITRLIVSVAICQCAGFIGSFFTVSSIGNWYQTLVKPTFNPPGWLFGPVWIILYFMMGVSLYLIWVQWPLPGIKTVITVFGIQLLLNALWSILFFGLKLPSLAFIEIILLFIAIAVTLFLFLRISKPAALLLIPYLCWVGFASILNYSIWRLN